ncbi:MAG: SDR family oxidoreductase [Opitutales bacterium]|nr:SDR family oxidoreductase [Opitutales bacterium]
MKNVLITGATSGIGWELATQLRELDYNVFATGRDLSKLTMLRSEFGCLCKEADLTVSSEIPDLFEDAHQRMGSVDILINNAGLNNSKCPVAEINEEDWDQQYAVNLRAPFLLCREAMRVMQPRKQGHIININSTVAKTSMPNYAIYSTMKYGLMGFTQCLIKEASQHNIKVTSVHPGGTDTDFREAERPDYLRADSTAKMIIQCITTPDDVVVHDLTFRPIIESNF